MHQLLGAEWPWCSPGRPRFCVLGQQCLTVLPRPSSGPPWFGKTGALPGREIRGAQGPDSLAVPSPQSERHRGALKWGKERRSWPLPPQRGAVFLKNAC